MYTHVYVCICMYMRVYACMHVYSRKGYKYSKYWEKLHSHTGTVAQFTSLDQIDGGSRPENVKGVLHSFEDLFGCWLHGCVSFCWQSVPSSPLGQEYLREKFYVQYTFIYVHILSIYACILHVGLSGMRINVPKSVATGFDFAMGRDLPTEGIQYEGSPLPGLEADEAFTYLGVRASLVCQKRRRRTAPCLTEEKAHVFAVTKDLVSKARRHKYLLCQMVLAMHMVATSRFRYSAPLVPWRDAELDKLHAAWLQVERAA